MARHKSDIAKKWEFKTKNIKMNGENNRWVLKVEGDFSAFFVGGRFGMNKIIEKRRQKSY